MSRVVLTFKNNEKEKKIEEFLDSKLSPAGYLKELVWEVINGNQISIPVIAKEQSIQTDEDVTKEKSIELPTEESLMESKKKVGGFGKK
ncbi:hypothetical protein [Paraclostridium sordellii]|uniref:hypothetical protein n=1 Tax=Paraclostridium sordellii TaxID=1505 RepID=UPI0005E74D57|nr:hypothetical protein [Paeniclostridium sordellii]MDU1456459.1 hypothetical protein [Paeniclostridium sordellii]CEN77467.1 Uncharacterised protein [[Clostridium] sordellii] [Paeniclostridium sordellii]